MGKIIAKIVAKEIFHYYDKYFILYLGQMGGQKERLTIKTVTILVHIVQEKWDEK